MSSSSSTKPPMPSTPFKMSTKGPLGEWQPLYDTTYTILMQTVNLPHLCVLTFLGILYYATTGVLVLNPLMPLVS
eukprot:scaffold13774_cov153-Amphora_coffeaeformis.AAC.1